MSYRLHVLTLWKLVVLLVLAIPSFMTGAILLVSRNGWPAWAFLLCLFIGGAVVAYLCARAALSPLSIRLDEDALVANGQRIPYDSIQGVRTSLGEPGSMIDEVILRYEGGRHLKINGWRVGPSRDRLRALHHVLSSRLASGSFRTNTDTFGQAYPTEARWLSRTYHVLFWVVCSMAAFYLLGLLLGWMRFRSYSIIILLVLGIKAAWFRSKGLHLKDE